MMYHQQRLPYDAEVEYLESEGNGSGNGQVISTDVLIPVDCTHVEYHFKFSFSKNQKGVLCGHQTHNYGNPRTYLFYTNSDQTNRQFYSGYSIGTVSLSANDIFEGSAILDSETESIQVKRGSSTVLQASTNGTFLNHDYPIVFFGGSHGNALDDCASMKVYYFKIIHGNQVVRDFIPVRAVQTGYMYDKVSGQLFGNAGSGNFTLGQDVVRVEYIESTGTQWIDTGYKLATLNSIRVIMDFSSVANNSQKNVFGSNDVNGFNVYFQSENTIGFYFCGAYVKQGIPITYDKRAVIDISVPEGAVAGKVLYDGVEYQTNARVHSQSETNFFIFTQDPQQSRASKLRVFSCKIYDNDILVRDLIPVRIGSEGAMKDLITGKIYQNSGSGNFIIGNDIESNEGKIAWLNLQNKQLMPFLPRYSFGVVSDLHVNSTSNGAPEDIERMFKKFENRHISKVFCCGDITTNHTAAQLSTFTDIKDQHPDIDFYSCNGNYDVGLTDAEWQTYVGHPFKHWFMWHNDAFIFMPIDAWEGSHPYQANLEWLEGLLQDLASTRVFLFIHFPLNSNSMSFQYPGLKIGQTYGFSSDSEDNVALIQMLKDHGNVIVFTGHSHYAFETQDEQVSGEQMVFFEEDGVSHVHVPSLSRPRNRSMEYIEDGHPELQPSQGLQVDVYDKFVKVRGIEFNLTAGDGRKGNDRLQNLYVGQNALYVKPIPYDAEVEYLESTGTQWIDTGINPQGAPTIVADMQMLNSYDRDYFGNKNSGVNYSESIFIVNFYAYRLYYYRYASNTSARVDYQPQGNREIWSIGKEVSINGVLKYTSPNTYSYDANQTNIFIFKSGRGNFSQFRLFSFKLYDGSVLVRDFIPVRFTNELDVSEGAMYDRVSGELFRNSGTGAFVIGPDKST